MDVLLLLTATIFGYILMYRLYGRYIAKRIFNLSDDAKVPSKELEDGIDYVPTRKEIIFGHHFTSIAGTGPIVGPAIAVIWGWAPAIIWVFLGSIVMGGIHDFGSLIISMRNQGKSISEYTSKYINPRTKFLFFLVVFLELWIVIAIFGMVIAIIFNMYPDSVFPVWMQIIVAVALGYYINKVSKNVTLATIIAVSFMYLTVWLGQYMPFTMPGILGIPATGSWTIILLIYAFIASVLPVTTLLQPRDYINAYQLVVAMLLLIIGIFAAAFFSDMHIVAPVYRPNPAEAPSMWPFLFITIACGAISGFHSLVSSGTSSKQVKSENDSLFVGYGSMLLEGSLAVIVIIAVSAGIGLGYEKNGEILTGMSAWSTHYSSWTAAQGLGSKITAFVDGSANMITSSGISREFALAVMGVFVASFAGTTLDTATRIQRYITTELFSSLNINIFKNIYISTFFAVLTAGILAFSTGANGNGALALWPLFGAVNQTLAALALIVITLYLKSKGAYKWMFAGIPAIFMSIMTLWASIINEIDFFNQNNWLLISVNTIVIFVVIIILIEGIIQFFRLNRLSNK
ncbi:MAG: carbon starvation protein A [Bacteroidales bacterium]|nr:carbon starvation protein A [Bacteroidales bacterium]MBN2757137.1 carbon starvation protein A [Bacteroidales bacterium]